MTTIASLGAGFLLFGLDMLLLVLLFRRLWRAGTRLGGCRLFLLLSLCKLPLLGGGVYLVLVVWRAELLTFVLGALAALLSVSGTLIVREVRTPRPSKT